MVTFLVNLPFVHETLTERKVAGQGQEVAALLIDTRTVRGHHYVDYRLPDDADPKRTRFSAEVDATTYEQARESRTLPVRAVPGDPASNRPDGQVRNATFVVVAVLGDAVLLAILAIWWRRRRRWNRHEVLDVAPGEVRLRGARRTLTAAAPVGWTEHLRVGQWVTGTYHLVAEHDLYPGVASGGLEQEHDATYDVGGQVVDTRSGVAVLELEDGFRIRVETGPHRVRADIREPTQVRGLLCFTPGFARGFAPPGG